MRTRTSIALLTTALTLTVGTTATAAASVGPGSPPATEQVAAAAGPDSQVSAGRNSAARLATDLAQALERQDLAAVDRLIADDIVLTQPFALGATRDEAPTYTGREEVLAFI
ncbi:MAG: nuclear transport factor 2 family protein, partial [Phycicoccus sp.]